MHAVHVVCDLQGVLAEHGGAVPLVEAITVGQTSTAAKIKTLRRQASLSQWEIDVASRVSSAWGTSLKSPLSQACPRPSPARFHPCVWPGVPLPQCMTC